MSFPFLTWGFSVPKNEKVKQDREGSQSSRSMGDGLLRFSPLLESVSGALIELVFFIGLFIGLPSQVSWDQSYWSEGRKKARLKGRGEDCYESGVLIWGLVFPLSFFGVQVQTQVSLS